jgi:hypothetical protein
MISKADNLGCPLLIIESCRLLSPGGVMGATAGLTCPCRQVTEKYRKPDEYYLPLRTKFLVYIHGS